MRQCISRVPPTDLRYWTPIFEIAGVYITVRFAAWLLLVPLASRRRRAESPPQTQLGAAAGWSTRSACWRSYRTTVAGEIRRARTRVVRGDPRHPAGLARVEKWASVHAVRRQSALRAKAGALSARQRARRAAAGGERPAAAVQAAVHQCAVGVGEVRRHRVVRHLVARGATTSRGISTTGRRCATPHRAASPLTTQGRRWKAAQDRLALVGVDACVAFGERGIVDADVGLVAAADDARMVERGCARISDHAAQQDARSAVWRLAANHVGARGRKQDQFRTLIKDGVAPRSIAIRFTGGR